MARRLKYSPELAERICKLVKYGVPIGTAAASEGICRGTFYEWRKFGEQGRAPYNVFFAQLEQAMAHAETQITLNVVSAARKDWRAGAWWIERQNPNIEQKLQRGLESLVEELRPLLSDGAYAELIQALAQLMGLEELAPEPAKSLPPGITEH